jgi:hypothetical protein
MQMFSVGSDDGVRVANSDVIRAPFVAGPPGTNETSIDFGLFESFLIGDWVFVDRDNDGRQTDVDTHSSHYSSTIAIWKLSSQQHRPTLKGNLILTTYYLLSLTRSTHASIDVTISRRLISLNCCKSKQVESSGVAKLHIDNWRGRR